jgi:hypothetical protein
MRTRSATEGATSPSIVLGELDPRRRRSDI